MVIFLTSFHHGTVERFNSKSNSHKVIEDIHLCMAFSFSLFSWPICSKCHGASVFALMQIAFDNGDVELVCLDSESWETLSHESMGQQVCYIIHHSSANILESNNELVTSTIV